MKHVPILRINPNPKKLTSCGFSANNGIQSSTGTSFQMVSVQRENRKRLINTVKLPMRMLELKTS